VSAFFAADAVVRLPGVAPIEGREAIRKALVQLSLCIDDLHHEPVQLWIAGNLTVFEADIALTLADHTALMIPVTHTIRWAAGMIQEARVNVYLESRLALALSTFDHMRAGYAGRPSHKSIGRWTSAARNGNSILRPWPAEA